METSLTRTFDLLYNLLRNYKKDDALAGKKNGSWIKYSTEKYVEIVNYVSSGLIELGIKPNDKVATIFSTNMPEWNFIDFGIAQIGAVHVPVYPTISDEDQEYILNHSESKILIVSDKSVVKKISGFKSKLTTIKEIYCVDEVQEIKSLNEIIESGKQNIEQNKLTIETLKSKVATEDVFTIIYTSGTTGSPKGVMLTHHNILSNAVATAPIQPMNNTHRILSFLPLCHVYERMMNYHFQNKGISIYYAENMNTIIDNLKEVNPHGFNTVPRLLEKVYLKIIEKGKDLEGIKKRIFFWALNLGHRFEVTNRGFLYDLQLKIADKLVFKKWREAIGGNIMIIVSGGSSLQPRLARVFWAAGIPVLEGYGLTETSPVISVNRYKKSDCRFGTVGPVLENVQVKFGEDGEILCKGPTLMKGYFKDEEYTRSVIDEEGWFHTGDIGEMIEDRFLKITDRKKEIFKLSSSKYIAPQVIENKFKASNLIDQLMVIGENEKFASAIISPNFNYLHFWALKHKIHFRDNRELINNPQLISRIQREVSEINKTLGQTEQIKRFRLVTEEWTPQTGELSPTLKLKRKVLKEKYSQLIKEIYSVG